MEIKFRRKGYTDQLGTIVGAKLSAVQGGPEAVYRVVAGKGFEAQTFTVKAEDILWVG